MKLIFFICVFLYSEAFFKKRIKIGNEFRMKLGM